MNDVRQCVICHEPASATLVIYDDKNEMRVGVCQDHGFEIANIRVVKHVPKGKKR